MKGYKTAGVVLVYVAMVIFGGCAKPAAHIKLASIFGDHMVLQQKIPIPVWGTATPGGQVRVTLASQTRTTKTDKNGRWQVTFKPLSAGGPITLTVAGRDTIRLKDILVGEVWLASGQSNMEFPVAGSWAKTMHYREELAHANFPQIRLFKVEKTRAYKPLQNVRSTGWQLCDSASVAGFSAVAYFFGRDLYRKLHIPIGLVQSCWGGTTVEAWMSAEGLKPFPQFASALKLLALGKSSEDSILAAYKSDLTAWDKRVAAILDSVGITARHWENPATKTADWGEMTLPTFWERAGYPNVDGVVWFRKEVTLPANWAGKPLKLSLGPINDRDVTWFNGVKVGSRPYVMLFREYTIPGKLVKPGKNVIVVQDLDIGGKGGLYGRPENLKLVLDKTDSISLAGKWKFKIDPFQLQVKKLPRQPGFPSLANMPTVLYNAMISPLIPMAFRGAIWYQGESNADRAYEYRGLFKGLIHDWRRHWSEGDFPFYFVQLANFMKRRPEPGESSWAELREAQTMALSLPNTGMAVTIDIGDATNIHPTNKQEVGRRLSLIARHNVYGEKNLTFSGPLYHSMKIEGNKIRIYFDFVDGGLVSKGSKSVQGFAIAGKDRKFYWAQAKIEANSVVVSSPQVPRPVAVRYAWADNPACNLYNKVGLPASPFRTDRWDGITKGKVWKY